MTPPTSMLDAQVSQLKEAGDKFIANVSQVIVGNRETIQLMLAAVLCGGHILIEDVPGTGKTMLAKAAARSLGCTFKRIQCTPDLLPSDVTGLHYFNQKSGSFEFHPGPIMSNIVLVDEINRATPRTQSCLLEAMQEQQVTVDLETVPLPHPFLLMATQNPVEQEGTFPLPEAQLDRFLFRLRLGYPSENDEVVILSRFEKDNPLENLNSVITAAEINNLQKLCRLVFVEESVRHYIVNLVRATRNHDDIELGASPRASLSLETAAQALAVIQGRSFVIPDDVKYLAVPVLAHRIIAKTQSRLRGQSVEEMVTKIVATVPVPVDA